MTKPFTSSEIQEIRDELKELKFILGNYDFEMNEDAWITLYADLKSYHNVSFLSVEFDEITEDGIGIEGYKNADIRWGTLLHSDDYARWAYWESGVEFPTLSTSSPLRRIAVI